LLTTLDLNSEPQDEIKDHHGEEHELFLREEYVELDLTEVGEKRKRKLVVEVQAPIYCTCQPDDAEPLCTANLRDEVLTSDMDEC
jgi:hypothetical protein